MIPLISISGCGHTGSSVLARILGTHSLMYFVNIESGMFLANRFFSHSDFFDTYQQDALINGKSFIIEKTPRHIWHVDYIRRCYPSTKFVLTTRSCFDTVASLYERTKDFQASLRRYQDDSILTIRQLNQPDTFLVQYESLIADPSSLLSKFCNWLDIEYEPSMLNYSDKPIDWNLNNPYSFGTLTNHDHLRNQQVNSPLKKSTVTWQERLPHKYHAPIQEFFSQGSIGYDIIRELGYM